MIEVSTESLTSFGIILFALVGVQVFVLIATIRAHTKASKERDIVYREMFGLLKKIEGLTAHRREQMLQEYDEILHSLSNQLPTTVAAEASTLIIETESKILTRLAELEPNLKEDSDAMNKMDELIHSMENLEETLVGAAANAVHKVMTDGRHFLEKESKASEAA